MQFLSLEVKGLMWGLSERQISPAASLEILHHTVTMKNLLFIAYSDER